MSITNEIIAEEKRRSDVEHDFEYSYFCDAGAGAGKTKLVVNRITEQLKSGKYLPEEIVAITFTNKAAQELCQRISSNLSDEKANNPSDSVVANALKDIGKMQVSTIHSFCHRLLKENCFESNLRLDFELLEDEDATKQKKAFFKEWVNSHASLYADWNSKLTAPLTYSDLESNFCDICDLPNETEFCYEPYSSVGPESLEKAKKSFIEHQEELVQDYKDALDEALLQPVVCNTPIYGLSCKDGSLERYLKKDYKAIADTVSIYKAIAKGTSPINKGSAGLKGKPTTDIICEAVDAYVRAQIDDKLNEVKEEQDLIEKRIPNALVNTVILEQIIPARNDYRAQLFNRTLSNDLILQRANALLSNPAVVEKLQSMFKCIYVDEFQDTDPIQNEMILKLCSKNGEIIPGMLFVVGDVKQSIYRFRNADYRLFNQTKALFSASKTCKVIELNINNRSCAELVDYFNDKVASLPVLMPGYIPMVPRQEYRSGEKAVHGVYQVHNAKPNCDTEPETIVEVIRHLMKCAEITEFDQGSKQLITRNVEYRDFLILTAKAAKMSDYVDTLQCSGIPTKVSLEYTPGEMLPVRRFVAIYRFLTTPFYKRAKEGLLEVAQGDTSFDLAENEELLKSLRAQVKGYNGAELAGWLLGKPELYVFSDDAISGHLVKRYQMAIHQMVDQVLSKVDNNSVAISVAFAEYANIDNSCARETSFDKNENAVRLMNIHKSKGLEGNIVIIADRIDNDGKLTSYTEGNKRYHVATITQQGYRKYKSPFEMNPTIRQKAEMEQAKENARLEYVAVTRAREALIFLDPPKENGMFEAYATGDLPELYEAFPECECETSSTTPSADTRLDAITKPSAEVFRKSGYRISPSSMEIHVGKYIAAPSVPIEDVDSIENSEYPTMEESSGKINLDFSDSAEILQKRPSGDIFGTVMHRAFELAIGTIQKKRSSFDTCVFRAINENADDISARYGANAEEVKQSFQQYLLEKMPAFVSYIQPKIDSADEVLTEYPFSLAITGDEIVHVKSLMSKVGLSVLPESGDEDYSQVWVNGRADLIIKAGSAITIIDYKSDSIQDMSSADFSQRIHQKYDNQMALYQWVMEKHFGGAVEGKFYSIEIGEIE